MTRRRTSRRGGAERGLRLLWTKLIRSFDIYDRPTARRIRSLNDSIFDVGRSAGHEDGEGKRWGRAAGKPRLYFAVASSPDHRRFPAISIFPSSFEISLNFLPHGFEGIEQ